MKTLTYTLSIGLILAVAACGGSDKKSGGGKQGMVNTATAKQASTQNVTTSTTLVGSADASAGMTAANNFYAAAFSAQGGISPAASAALESAMTKALGGMAAGTCECEGTTCTFTDCGDDGTQALVINGTLDWTGGNVKTDITFETAGNQGGIGSKTKVTIVTDLTVTATSISGTSSSEGDITVEGIEGLPGGASGYSWSTDLEYKDVTIANGTPTGGTVTYNGSYKNALGKYVGSSEITYP